MQLTCYVDSTLSPALQGHVLTKRYLTFKEPEYYDLLSPGSRRTLVFQGGPMSRAEAIIFEAGPHFEMCKQMRRWDEGAKSSTWKVTAFDAHVERILAAITEPPCDAKRAAELSARTSFIRDGNRIAGIRSSRL
jgi:predicted HD phosphohydrolase